VGHLVPCGYKGESGFCGGVVLLESVSPVGRSMVMMAGSALKRGSASNLALSWQVAQSSGPCGCFCSANETWHFMQTSCAAARRGGGVNMASLVARAEPGPLSWQERHESTVGGNRGEKSLAWWQTMQRCGSFSAKMAPATTPCGGLAGNAPEVRCIWCSEASICGLKGFAVGNCAFSATLWQVRHCAAAGPTPCRVWHEIQAA